MAKVSPSSSAAAVGRRHNRSTMNISCLSRNPSFTNGIPPHEWVLWRVKNKKGGCANVPRFFSQPGREPTLSSCAPDLDQAIYYRHSFTKIPNSLPTVAASTPLRTVCCFCSFGNQPLPLYCTGESANCGAEYPWGCRCSKTL